MQSQMIRRRSFLQATVAGAAGIVLGGPATATASSLGAVKIEQPFHGAVLNHRHGRQTSDGLTIRVTGNASLGDRVLVNGQPTERAGTTFSADVLLSEKETDIAAVSEGNYGRGEHRVRVVWDRHSEPRYRFAIDDNIFFLRDIARNDYQSLFDCFYLEILRKLQRQYGARFVLNIYFTDGEEFDLTQFPGRYKKEWQDNADWLKLAFHAHANDPARPYQYASPQTLVADFDKVAEQIHRFAGEQAYSPTTLIHWAMVQPTAFKPLAQRGVKVLSGYFRQRNGVWDINYNLDDARSEYLSRHDALKDFDSGIVFTKVELACNHLRSIDDVIPTLKPLRDDPNHAEIMDLTTHEQPFWPFWRGHLPDHAKRVETAIRWVTEHGYKPVFFHEGFLGGQA